MHNTDESALLLLPLGGHKAPLGLWRGRQRVDLLVAGEPVYLWLKGIHLSMAEHDMTF